MNRIPDRHLLFRKNKVKLTGTLHDMELLNCTICYKILQPPIYQCSFGEVFCGKCLKKCLKIGSNCPKCQLHLGKNRCWILERFLSVISIGCPFSADCHKQIPFNTVKEHEKYGCVVSKCYCPNHIWCGEKGSAEHIANHFVDNHWLTWTNTTFFEFNQPIHLFANDDLGLWILFSWTTEILFGYQCTKGDEGLFLQVSCLSPPLVTQKFSYALQFEEGDGQINFECREMEQKLRFFQDLPRRSNSMIIPNRFLHTGDLKVKLTISKEQV